MPNPTDRGKLGSKRHLIVDRNGIPLAVCVTGANRHDSVVFEELIDALPPIGGKPGRPRRWPDKLHADKAYDIDRCRAFLKQRGIIARIARKGIARNDAALLEEGATAVDVVSLVGVQFVWPTSRAPWFATNWRQGVDQLLEHDRVVPIGAGDAHRQGDAVAIDDQMPFAAEFAAIGRVRPGIWAPRGGEATLAASRPARLRSSV